MAVDTKQKRQSALNFLRAFSPRLLFPDGTINQGDRQAALVSYSGILATITLTPPNPFIPRSVHHTQTAKTIHRAPSSVRVVKGGQPAKIVR